MLDGGASVQAVSELGKVLTNIFFKEKFNCFFFHHLESVVNGVVNPVA